jgi:hypothetical protein
MSRRAPKRRVAVSDDDEAADIQSPAKRGRIATSSGNESEEEANGTAKARVLDKGKGRAAQDEVMEDEDDEEESGEEEEEEEEEEEDNAEEVPAERPVEILRPELERGDDG